MSADERYFADASSRLAELAQSQAAAIAKTADLGAAAIAAARPIHIFDTGHLVNHEFIDRTGGLAAYTALNFSASIDRENEWINASRAPSDPTGEVGARALVDWMFLQGTVLPEDVLILSSVSGTNVLVVELARQARARGVHVVALTGVEFSAQLSPAHSSGTRLFENADVVLDNRVPFGDAALQIEGIDARVAPWSGVSAALLLWSVTAGIIERCVAAGVTPTVYSSYNLPGGGAAFARARETYRETGR